MGSRQSTLKFNVKNVKYTASSSVKDLTFATSLSLENDYEENAVYGDGEVILTLANDKGKTGTLGVIDIDKGLETDLGRLLEIADGVSAEIQQYGTTSTNLYYEVEAFDDGERIVIKNWLLGVKIGKATESYEQTTDEINLSEFEYPLIIEGTNLKTSAGSSDFTDSNNNTVKVYRMIAYPDDTGYANFGTTVPVPKAKSQE